MLAETRKEVMVEYPLDIVYKTLVGIFPVKYYKLRKHYDVSHSLKVYDSFNQTFELDIYLVENTPDTTIITFHANYPHALMDLTKGGTQAIEMILEELLNELDKQPKTGAIEARNSEIPVVNSDNFVNTTKNKKHTAAIIVGYILCVLSIVLPTIAIINYNPDDIIMFTLFITGILCLSIEISLAVVLQYYEDPKSILHGRNQIILCGLSLILLGYLIHPGLAIAGIIIPIYAIMYFRKRRKSIE